MNGRTKTKKPLSALFILGTRPEAIKLAPVISEMISRRKNFVVRVCNTGQHKELFDQTAGLFWFEQKYKLDLMRHNQSLSGLTSALFHNLAEVFEDSEPDLVLVQGDTTSCFAGALSAFYHKVRVAHVEAGLRTFQKYSPFPEEINRKLTGSIADLHFAPTEKARDNLLAEGVPGGKVFLTGNTVIDALLTMKDKLDGDLGKKLAAKLNDDHCCGLARPFVLVTGHRRENFGEGFQNICEALVELAKKFENFNFIYPVHLNPNVREPVNEMLDGIDNIKLLPPLQYEYFIYLLTKCELVLTDSGGVQEEAPALGKPVVVMRKTTERPEAVDTGAAVLAGPNREGIIKQVSELIQNRDHYNKMAKARNPFGDGKAAKKIVDIIEKEFNLK